MDFAETKTSVIIFVYRKDIDTSSIVLKNNKTLSVPSYDEINLYKEVSHIETISESSKCIEIVLIKNKAEKWYNINGPEKRPEPKKQEVSEESDHETSTSDNDIMRVLDRIYENGDENTKRAMEKSLLESNGTVLSTNWEDVKDNKNNKTNGKN